MQYRIFIAYNLCNFATNYGNSIYKYKESYAYQIHTLLLVMCYHYNGSGLVKWITS